MTPAQFDRQHQAVWDELTGLLDALEQGKRLLPRGWRPWRRRPAAAPAPTGTASAQPLPASDPARLAALYRRSCEHLALARSRNYPVSRVAALEALTGRAHQAIYRHHGNPLRGVGWLLRRQVPASVRQHRVHVALALAAFGLPLLLMLAACWLQPSMVLTVMEAGQAQEMTQMYAPSADVIGRQRGAGDDMAMFGFYIAHNIGIAFQCFASGLLLGVGALYYLLFNGAVIGAVAGYLTAGGQGPQFWPFVVTHGAYELTAIVLSGACGLRLGQAVLMPGRQRRLDALAEAGQQIWPLLVATTALLLVAAAIEAFWSSAGWVEPRVKFVAGAFSWALVMAWLGGWLGGAEARAAQAPHDAPESAPESAARSAGGDDGR
ncbi:stage II sporulation protein M [Ideonella sp.]|uniref:stage II sporulation protein M n=1 Tax=Ideonella sp. TaxID=1929293 RepID=UPI003BB65D20